MKIINNKLNIIIVAVFAALAGILIFFSSGSIALKAAAGLAVMLLTFLDPIYGVYIMILAIPIISSNVNIVMLAAGLLTAYTARIIIRREDKFVSAPINMPILVFLGILTLSTVFSISQRSSLKFLIFALAAFGMYFMIVNVVNTREKLNNVIKLFVFITFIMACYGILQYFIVAPMDELWGDISLHPDLKARTVATFSNPNTFAEYLEYMLPVAVALFFAAKGIKKKLINGFVAATMVICLILTFSRGSYIGFAAAMLVFVIIKYARHIPVLIISGIAALPFAVRLMPAAVVQRASSIGSLADSSNAYRVLVWQGTLRMIKDFWISGIGLGHEAFQVAFLEYTFNNSRVEHAHNTLLEIAAESGITGLLVFLWILAVFVISIIKFSNNTKNRLYSFLSIGLLCSVVSLLAHGIAEHIFYEPKLTITFWIVAGLAMAVRNVGISLESEC